MKEVVGPQVKLVENHNCGITINATVRHDEVYSYGKSDMRTILAAHSLTEGDLLSFSLF